MKKKFLISLILLSLFLILFSSYNFANTKMMNNIEQGMNNVTSDMKNTVNRGIDATKNTVNDMSNGVKKMDDNIKSSMTQKYEDASNYTAEKTSSDTFLGMNSTGWTWLIIGISAIAIVALIWLYARQYNSSTNSNE